MPTSDSFTDEKRLLESIESSLRDTFSDIDKGVLELRFMSMNRGTEISTDFDTDENIDSRDVRTRIIENIGLSKISELRKSMSTNNEHGAWLSGIILFNCLTEEFSIEFNYYDRFNVLTEKWEYSDTDEQIFPDRNTLLNDFEKFPREEKHIPDWYYDLVYEQKQIKQMIKNAKSDDVFEEQINVVPSINEKFDYLNKYADWNFAWDELSKVYIRALRSDRNMVALFVDDSRIPDRAEYVFEELEPVILDKFLNRFIKNSTMKDRANMVNFVQFEKGMIESYNNIDDAQDLDSEMLEEEFEEIIISLIMSQTRQRFPDLDDVIF